MGSSRASDATPHLDNAKRYTTSPVAKPQISMGLPHASNVTTHHEHDNRSPTNKILLSTTGIHEKPPHHTTYIRSKKISIGDPLTVPARNAGPEKASDLRKKIEEVGEWKK
ncbi:hypothetical protein YC2023_084507 [Brassica napus]